MIKDKERHDPDCPLCRVPDASELNYLTTPLNIQGFRVKEGLSCVFAAVKQPGKARNLALPSLENPV